MTLRKTADKLFSNLDFTHKVHEKQCEVLSISSTVIKLISIAIIVAILVLQFLQVIHSDNISSFILNWSIGLVITEIALLAFQLNFNFDKLLDQHRNTAKRALSLKNELLIYVADENRITKDGLESFVQRINSIYNDAPQTGYIAKFLANRPE